MKSISMDFTTGANFAMSKVTAAMTPPITSATVKRTPAYIVPRWLPLPSKGAVVFAWPRSSSRISMRVDSTSGMLAFITALTCSTVGSSMAG